MNIFSEYWYVVMFAGIPAYLFILWLVYRSSYHGLMIRAFTWTIMVAALLAFWYTFDGLEAITRSWALFASPLMFFLIGSGATVAVLKHFDSLRKKGMMIATDDSFIAHLSRDNFNKGFLAIIRLSIGISLLASAAIGFFAIISSAFFGNFVDIKHYVILIFSVEIVVGMLMLPYISKRSQFIEIAKLIVFIVIASAVLTLIMSIKYDYIFMLRGLSVLATMLAIAAVIYMIGITAFKKTIN